MSCDVLAHSLLPIAGSMSAMPVGASEHSGVGREEQGADAALLRFLSKHGAIDPGAGAAALRHVAEHGGTALEALIAGNVLGEEAIVELFQRILRLPRADAADPSAALATLDIDVLRRHLVAPVEVRDGRLLLAMANPLDHEAIPYLRFATGLRVQPAVAPLSAVRAALARLAAAGEELAEAQHPVAPELDVNDSPIVKLGALLIEQGIRLGASDIHLEPTGEGVTLRYRIDGVLEEASRLSASVRNPLIARLKVMARLDIAERRVPQDGGLTCAVDGRRIDCRVSTLPTQYGEKVVIRLLDATRGLAQLDQLGFEPEDLARVREGLAVSEGLILTTGPTGSGKTTTLYAMLQALRSPTVNIVTVENPIEYRLAGINQTEVNERQGMTFATALRSILRQDPDVILIGEIRDRETAAIAVQAAQTGHLVLSTLHTNDAVGAITRLSQFGIERELIASSLLLVIAQRLVRRVCAGCGEAVPAATWAELPFRQGLGSASLRRGRGCPACRGTGFLGRCGAYELVRPTADTRRLISAGAGEDEVRDAVRRQGGRTLLQSALGHVRAGRTTPDEVAAVIKPDDGCSGCPACGALPGSGDGCALCGSGPTAGDGDGDVTPPAPAAATHPARAPLSVTLSAPVARGTGSALGAAVRGLSTACGLDDAGAVELELAVVEACHLAAEHAEELRVEVEASSDGCTVCVCAAGAPWAWPRPQARPPALEAFTDASVSPEVRAFIIRSSVDEASFERAGDVNRLWLIKRPHWADDTAHAAAENDDAAA